MTLNHDGSTYEFLRGSDVVNDGMYLEASILREGQEQEIVLFAFYSDADGGFTFSAFKQDLPFTIVEEFIRTAREVLPS